MERVDRESEAVPDGTWTVGQLNTEIEQALADASDRFPTYVVGEVGEVDHYDFGTFFELRDTEEEPSIACLAWAGAVAGFDHDLAEGVEGVVEAEVDFYPDRGDCQLLVSEYWPLGESTRQQELDQLRAELAAEGLFAGERKKEIPAHPSCLGLVTSPAGSAREDVWATVSERSPRTDVRLCGASVQGERAVPSLVEAVESLDPDPAVETLILTRGGGADSDLRAFDAEPLVRAVAACSTPVVVAVGHEDDQTLVEAVADARAMTPTEAGVVATTPVEDVLGELAALERRVVRGYDSRVESRLAELTRRIDAAHESLTHRVQQRDAVRDRAHDLGRRVTLAYDGVVTDRLGELDARIERGYRVLARNRLGALERRLDSALAERELTAESEATTARVVHGRLGDIEARIDGAFRARTTRELDTLERRIESAYRELETSTRTRKRETEARRLRVVVAVLAVLLVVTLGVVGVLVL